MRQRAEWRHKLAAAHPDHGGSNDRFRLTRARQQRWQLEEYGWYARIGLLPPDGFSPPALTGRYQHFAAVRARNRRALAPINPLLETEE